MFVKDFKIFATVKRSYGNPKLNRGLHPEEFFDIEYEEVSSKLDKLALEVQSYLSIKNPNHPAVSIELISPEVPLQNSVWSHDETSELFETIRHVLCKKNTSRKSDIENIYFHKCSTNIPGLDNYFSIIFKAVSHRLGIHLHPILYFQNFLFLWKSSE
ncbi:hypothetical protein Avbf_15310 [Armadillidium vulgare]|nr:hypothetical protein Avbf_15310 [Armadillidium vulgare]